MTIDQLNSIRAYLENQGYECVSVDSPKPFIDVLTVISGKDIRLRCTFPVGFPNVFPNIYILKEFYREIRYLPHVNSDLSICIFDKTVSRPNPDKPHELVFECFKKAIEILDDGINGRNLNDFKEEIEAYWIMKESNDTVVPIEVYTLFECADKPKELTYYKVADEVTYYVTDKYEKLKDFLHYRIKRDQTIEKNQFRNCLFLPLGDVGYPLYPKNNQEIYHMVKRLGYIKPYQKFIKKTNGEVLVLFSQNINGQNSICGWIQILNKNKAVPGFRRGKVKSEILMLGYDRNKKIYKFVAESLNKERLFYRGGDGLQLPDSKVLILGCGSVGSFLCEAMVRIGISEFTLFDNDVLTSDNIARHACGAAYIGKYKTNALKRKMIEHFPFLRVNEISGAEGEFYKALDENIGMFNSNDFNFIAVGDSLIENNLIQLFNKREIIKPLVLLWVEPYMLGGHAVILQKPQENLSEVYNEQLHFTKSVLTPGKDYSKKEAGCQSTFIPYSSFEMQLFINSFLDYFNNNMLLKKKEGNYLFSWAGKLHWARKNGFDLSDEWIAADDREVVIKRLDR